MPRTPNNHIARLYATASLRTTLYEESTQSFWAYHDRHWRMLANNELEDRVASWCDSQSQLEGNQFTQSMYRDIAFQARRFYKDAGRTFWELDDRWLAFDDVLVNPDTLETAPHPEDSTDFRKLNTGKSDVFEALLERNRTMQDIYSERIASVRIKFSYADLDRSEMPLFRTYLEDSFRREDGTVDEQSIMQLQEQAAYLLSSESVTKAFLNYGDGGTGKSVWLAVLRALVSEQRCVSMTPAELTVKDFNLPALIGKKANIRDEIKAEKIDMAKLKALIDCNPQSTRKMYQEVFTYRPKAKHFFGLNEFPQTGGFDNSIRRRFVITSFENIVPPDRIDRNLSRKIVRDELPAIVNWALQGLQRLHINNFTFTMTESSEKSMQEFQNANSSVAEFLSSMYVTSQLVFVPVSDVYCSYTEWAKENKRQPVSSGRFAREAQAVLGKASVRWICGKSQRCYGAELKSRTAVPTVDFAEQPSMIEF